MFHNDKELKDTLFHSISMLKESYEEGPAKDIKFIDYVEHALKYLTALATAMQKNKNIPYIYQPMDESNIYARFFCESYEKKIFTNEKKYNDYRLGFQYAKKLISIEQNKDKSFTFSISNQILFNYLFAANPREILNNRIRHVIESLDNNNHDDLAHKTRIE